MPITRPRSFRKARFVAALGALAISSVTMPAQSPPLLPYGILDIGALGGAQSAAYDIADVGQVIVGKSQTPGGGAEHAFAQGYFGLKEIGLGGARSAAHAVSSNVVVGQALTAAGQERAFAADVFGNTITNLGTLGGSWSAAYDVRYGIVVGASRIAGDARLQAFRYVNGSMTALPVNRGGNSVAKAVNNWNDVGGYACTAGNTSCRAFYFSGDTVSDLGLPAGNSVINSMNDNRQIAGSYDSGGGRTHAFLHQQGITTDLGTLGGTRSEGLAINESGEIVGTAQNGAGVWRAFLWRGGTMIDLNTLLPSASGWQLESATSISLGGQIVGIGLRGGMRRAFLLTPPTDLAVLAGGARTQEDSNLPRGIEAGKTVRFVTSAVTRGNGPGVTIYDAQLVHTLAGPAEFVDARSVDGRSCEVTPKRVTCDLQPFDSVGEIWLRARATGPGAIAHTATIDSSTPDPNAANNRMIENNRAIALATFELLPSTVAGGNVAAARVSLTDLPPAGDAVLRVISSRPDIAAVPAQFVVPSWSQTREFHIVPKVVSASAAVTITISYGLVTLTRTLTVLPPKLAQLYLTPTTVIGGCGTSSGRIMLTGPAPAGGAVVPLTNTNTRASAPSSVTVPAGANSATFSVTTTAVTSLASGRVTASYGGVSQSLAFDVRPIRARAMTFAPNPVRGGVTVTGTITLECPAAPGPMVVSFTSSNPAAAAPVSSVTIPAGRTSAQFAVRTFAPTANTPVSISAWVFGVRKLGGLTVTP